MEIQQLNCPSCGAPLPVTAGLHVLSCPYCAAHLAVKWDRGQAELELAERLGAAIQVTASATQDAIHDGAATTQAELRRLQLAQDLSLAQLQLANLDAETRALERQKKDRAAKRQLRDLSRQESSLRQRISSIQRALAVAPAQPAPRATQSPLPAPPTDRPSPLPPVRRPVSPVTLILVGVPSLVGGVVCLLLFLFAQLTGEAGPADNLVGFTGAVFVCPVPLILIGAALAGIGVFLQLRRSGSKSNGAPAGVEQ